jgi:hypothetical protein
MIFEKLLSVFPINYYLLIKIVGTLKEEIAKLK